MKRWIVAAGIPLMFGIALAACSGSESGTTLGNGAPMSEQDATRRAERW